MLIGSVDAAVPAEEEPDATLEWEAVLEDLDPAALQDLDTLLRDPVRLDPRDLHRLLWLPWITLQQVEELRRALPIRQRATWEGLPSWGSEAVERVVPFVVLPAPRATTPVRWRGDIHVRPAGAQERARFETGRWRLAARADQTPQRPPSAFATFSGKHLSVWLGDQRRSVGLGLLVASRISSSSVHGSFAWGERWSGSTSSWRERVMRGFGSAWHGHGWFLTGQQGTHEDDTVRLLGAGRNLGESVRLSWSTLRCRGRQWVGVLLERSGNMATGAVEFVQQPQGWVAALGLQRRMLPWLLEARVVVAPDGATSPLGGLPASARDAAWAHVRARGTWSRKSVRLRATWAQTLAGSHDHEERHDLELQAVVRRSDATLDVRWRATSEQHSEVDLESLLPPVEERDEILVVRSEIALGGGRSVLLERRSRRLFRSDPTLPHGQVWRLVLRQGASAADVDLSLAFFDAMPGATVVVSEPGVGSAPALAYGSTRGTRLAMRLRRRWRGMQAALRASAGWTADGAWNPAAEVALRLRADGRNGF